jgi:hypothetical protein
MPEIRVQYDPTGWSGGRPGVQRAWLVEDAAAGSPRFREAAFTAAEAVRKLFVTLRTAGCFDETVNYRIVHLDSRGYPL